MDEIIIDKDGDYEFVFEDKKDVDLKIIVKENVSCRIFEFMNVESNKKLTFEIAQGALVKHYSIVIKTKGCDNYVKQGNKSKYVFKGVNFAKNSSYYTNNSACLNDEESFCSMKIVNVANKSKISSNGLIKINEKSMMSEGHQKFEGVILDNESSIEAKPELEVLNDNVICSHGASITQIDDNKLFYLRSKGFDKEQSINLIVHGYFDSILSEMPKSLEANVRAKLKEKKII